MATLNARDFSVDSNLLGIASLRTATLDSRNALYCSFHSDVGGDRWITVSGSDLRYEYSALSQSWMLVGGVITDWSETVNGKAVFRVSSLSVDVQTFLTWVDGRASAAPLMFDGADTMTGSVESDTLSGLAGDDRLYGAAGNDSLHGGAGNDTLRGESGGDWVVGGLGNDNIIDVDGSNYLRGNEGDDVIVGGADFDDVHGNQGNDTISGAAGDDWVVGGQDNDLQYGGDGWDIVYGNLGADTLNGDAGDDWVRGGQQGDVLNGGEGNDWLSGDRDNDTITGGAGADLFNLFDGAGLDWITDFNPAEGDRIRWEGGLPSSLAMSQVGADTVITYNSSNIVTLVGVQASSLTGTNWWVVG